jgi:hypothetical protein
LNDCPRLFPQRDSTIAHHYHRFVSQFRLTFLSRDFFNSSLPGWSDL